MSGEDQEQRPFSREMDRDYRTHNFRQIYDVFGGRTDKENYYGDHKTHQFAQKMQLCQKEAITYFQVMAKRVEEEQPDYFEEKGVSKGKFL